MKMESALDVLSRAASIVQSVNTQSPSVVENGKIDSDRAKDYSSSPSPRERNIPKMESDLDHSHNSPKEIRNIKIEDEPLSNDQKPQTMFTIKKNNHETDHPLIKSDGKLLTAVEYLQKTSPKHLEMNEEFSLISPKSFIKQDESMSVDKSPNKLNKAVRYLHDSSLKDNKLYKPSHSEICSPEQLSPERQYAVKYHQVSPKHLPRFDSEKRKSPKREFERSPVNGELQPMKRIKVEESDEIAITYQHRSKSSSPIICDTSPRLVGKTDVSMNTSKSPPVHIVPRYMHSYPQYPPLFIFTDKPTNYSKLMATYDSIFTPTPPLVPPYLPPAYTKCNCGDKNCTLVSPKPKPPKYEPSPAYKEKSSESNEYSLPNVDEHFRKSLGEKYNLIDSEHVNERPSSVDDHFAKALGQKWYTMDCSKYNT